MIFWKLTDGYINNEVFIFNPSMRLFRSPAPFVSSARESLRPHAIAQNLAGISAAAAGKVIATWKGAFTALDVVN